MSIICLQYIDLKLRNAHNNYTTDPVANNDTLNKKLQKFPSGIPYIIPNTKIPNIIISVIAEYILFLLFCFLLVKPTMAKNIDRNNNINAMKIIKLQTIASHKPITKNVRMRHNKLNKPNFVLFNLVVFIILIFYNTNCLKE